MDNVITIGAGESFYRDVAVWNDELLSEVHDITNATVTFEVFTGPGRDRVLIGGATIIDATTGKILIMLEPAQTLPYGGHVFYYSVILTEDNGAVSNIDDGKLIVKS